jgi:hypothetical protein
VCSIKLEDTEYEGRRFGRGWVHGFRTACDLTRGIGRWIIDGKLLIATLNRRAGANSRLRSALDNSA